jgi:hypothetical protein
MSLVPAIDPSPADWFVTAEGPWYVTATYGPPSLEMYARVSLERVDEGYAHPSYYPADDERILRSVLDSLGAYTVTRDTVHVGIWEGWGYSIPEGVRFKIPGREYALLTGPITDVLDPGSLGLDAGESATPHLIWPDDHAWFICWDTDEEWNFTIGGSAQAITEVVAGGKVVAEVVPYGTPEPGWTW